MKFLVIGEICLDVFVKCRADRICPEAAALILNPIGQTENYGMAGNVVANLKSLGGEDIIVNTITPTNTIIKRRYVDKQSGSIIIRIDENDKVDIEDAFSNDLLVLDSSYSGVIVSDYNKGFLNAGDICYISKKALSLNVPIFVDTKKILGTWSENITFVKINEKEFSFQKEHCNNPEYWCENLIVTLGENGCKWINGNVQMPVDPIEIADLSGAGDSYLAAFALEFCKSKYDNFRQKVQSAMNFSNRAARIAVSKRGVISVKAEEIL